MAAVLSADMQHTDKIVVMVEESRRMGLQVLPPDINQGQFSFTVNGRGQIVYGLGAIKGLGEGPIHNLIQVRKTSGSFTDLFDFCKRVELGLINKRAIEALIRAGACDSFGADRAVLLASMGEAVKTAEQNSMMQRSGVGDLFGETITPVSSGDVYANFRHIRAWSEQRRLQEEKQTLGLYLSGHPISGYLPELSRFVRNNIHNLKPEKGSQLIAGLVHEVRQIKSKKGDAMAAVTLDDRSGRIEATLFPDIYQQYRGLLQEDNILVMEGNVSLDDFNGASKLKVTVRRVMRMEEARREYARSLSLSLQAHQLQVESLAALEAMLGSFRLAPEATSGCNIVVHIEVPGEKHGDKHGARPGEKHGVKGTLALGRDWRVQPDDELLSRLRDRFGHNAVALHYQ
jgi:DNA polymerase-3 subunit alpha